MRLVAGADTGWWRVYHCEAMCFMYNVVMVDDTDNVYETLHIESRPTRVYRRIHQAKKVVILTDAKLILINPIQDHEFQSTDSRTEATEHPTSPLGG